VSIWHHPFSIVIVVNKVSEENMLVSKYLLKFLRMVAVALVLLPVAHTTVMAEEEHPYAKDFDVKANFRNICGFCHQSYGRQEGKGPQLMNSTKTDEELFNRIKNGKSGRMAAFGVAFSDDKIWAIVKFIRSLKADVEPENPS
jgi:mono/diheme cytochrome c family protein